MRQKPTEGYADRLETALLRGPNPMSVRGLHRAMEERHPDMRGTSYGGIRQYAENKVKNPRIELLRAIAEVLGVRGEWLAFDEGAMTEEEEEGRLAEVEAAKASGRFPGSGEDGPHVSPGLQSFQTVVLAALDHQRADVPAWVPSLLRVHHALPLYTDVGAALRAPLDALGIDPGGMGRDALDDYVTAMVPVLGMLAPERHRPTDQEDDNA